MTRKLLVFLATLTIWSAAWGVPTPVDKGWEEFAKEDGITVWRKDIEGSPVVAFRGEAVMDASIAKVATVLIDTARKKEWVARLAEAKNILEINDYERIEYNHTATPIVISDRDFVFQAKAEFDKAKKQMIFRLRSVEDASTPERDGIVRGRLMNSAYTLTSIEDGKKTLVAVEILADPMGSVPKWIVNLFQKSWPKKTLEGIRNQVAKSDVFEHPGVKAIFATN
jgi:hypothetical protein